MTLPSSGADVARAALDRELAPEEADNRDLGLAKAVARQCVSQLGVEKSKPAIEAVREFKTGVGLRRSHETMRVARVLVAAPRDGFRGR